MVINVGFSSPLFADLSSSLSSSSELASDSDASSSSSLSDASLDELSSLDDSPAQTKVFRIVKFAFV
jgi:hypothetical protein